MLLPESRRKTLIGVRQIEETIATMARIPPKSVSKNDASALRDLAQDLKRVVFGQDKAIDALAASIKLARAGLREPEKPIGCYLFSGPTGVGKTEVARQLSSVLGVNMLRFDMSEYMERHSVSRLIGAPPGYVGFDQGGLLTDGIDQHPHTVLLLDEIEKAHPDLFNILLQVMDHGKLTDHNGKSVDFRNVILIMTTNAGAAELAKSAFGFNRAAREGDDIEAVTRMFTPEFRNRLDAVIGFGHLPPEVVRMVVEKFVLQLEAQLAERQVNIELSDEARDWLARTGYDSQMGARPLARIIQEHVKRPLADEVLFGRLSNGGGTVRVVLETEDGKEKLGFDYLSRDEEKASKPPKPPGSAKPRKPSPPRDGGSGGGPGGSLVPRVARKPAGRKSEPV
jgi:ATP-dependent Clp protease ATP-binding subunit ClpA